MRVSSRLLLALALLALNLLPAAGRVSGEVITINPGDDAYVDEDSPTTNFGSDDFLAVRRAGAGTQQIALLAFDLSGLPNGAIVSSAILKCYYSDADGGDPTGRVLEARRIEQDWEEGSVTWSNQPASAPTAADLAVVPAAPGVWLNWDLTTEVQSVLAGAYDSFGWAIIDSANDGDFAQIFFHSQENAGGEAPYLEVDYFIPSPEWTGPIPISDASTEWCCPRIGVSGSYVHIIWSDAPGTLLRYRSSSDGGATWGTTTTLRSGVVLSPRIAVSGQNVYVVWRGATSIQYRGSHNDGLSFSPASALTSGANDGFDPDVTASGNLVYVTWIKNGPGYDVGFRSSSNGGTSWGTIGSITNDGAATVESHPRIAIDGSAQLHLAWIEADETEVAALLANSSNAGVSWSTPQPMWSEAPGALAEVAIAAYGSQVYVNRQSSPNGPVQRLSNDYGSTFTAETKIGDRIILDVPDVDVSAAPIDAGATEYIESIDAQRANFYATFGHCSEYYVGTLYGSTPTGDIAVDAGGDLHAVCSSQQAADTPPYRVLYYGRKAPLAATLATIPAGEDSYVNDTEPSSNFGEQSLLYAGDDNGNDPAHTCRTYLKFDLGAIPPNQEIAEARLYIKAAGVATNAIRTGAYHQLDDSWTEEGLSWENQPPIAASPADEHNTDQDWNCWSVTTDVRVAYAGDRVYSVVLKGSAEPDQGNWIGFSSREEAETQDQPYLEISYRLGTCECIPGDANGDDIANITDVVFLISYIFSSGPEPTPFAVCSGDANCDGLANITDVVFLISYIFASGDSPCSCEHWLSIFGPPF